MDHAAVSACYKPIPAVSQSILLVETVDEEAGGDWICAPVEGIPMIPVTAKMML